MGVISTYSLCLLLILIVTFFLSFTNLTKHKYLFIFIVTLSISILGMLYDPVNAFRNGNYTDLYRFYQTLDLIKGLPFDNNVLIFQEYNNIPVVKFVLFIISRIGINSLLPFIASFVFYGLFGIFLIKICEKYNLSNRIMGFSFWIFICIFNFKMVISNIRCPIGDAIFVLTLYYDLFNKNKNKNKLYLLGYLICCGIHPIFILFTILRLLFKVTNKFTDKFFYVCILLYTIFINFVLEFLNKFTGIELFNYLSMKLNFYINYWDVSSNEPLIVLSGIFYILILIYFLFVSKNKIKKTSSEEKFYKLSVAFVLLTISSFWNFVIFQRCTWLLIFFIIYWYLFLKSLKKCKSNNVICLYDIIIYILVIISLMFYFLTYQYGVLTF